MVNAVALQGVSTLDATSEAGEAGGLARKRRAALIALGLGWAALSLLFWDAARAMVHTWINTTAYNHGFLIAPICLYLAWERRAELRKLAPRPSLWGLAAIAAWALAWLVADFAQVASGEQLALVGMIQSLVLAVWGWRVVRALMFPILFLFAAVPMGESLIPPLQDVTAWFAVKLLELVGVPIYIEGLYLTIPNGRFHVAEACAGIRFLIAMLTLSLLFSYLFLRAWWRRILFVMLGIAIPIIANGFRAFGIVYIGYISDMTVAVGVDHIVYGFVFFFLVMVILLGIGWTMRDKPAPFRMREDAPRPAPGIASVAAIAVLGLLVAAVAPAYATLSNAPVELAQALQVPDLEVAAPWHRVATEEDGWRPIFRGADAETFQTFADADGRRVDVYVAYYAWQRDGAEIVHRDNKLFDGDLWSRAAGGRTKIEVDGAPLVASRILVQSPRGQRVTWSWYWVDGSYIADPFTAALLGAKVRLLGEDRAAAAIVLATPFVESPKEGEAVLRDFVASMDPLAPLLAGIRQP